MYYILCLMFIDTECFIVVVLVLYCFPQTEAYDATPQLQLVYLMKCNIFL